MLLVAQGSSEDLSDGGYFVKIVEGMLPGEIFSRGCNTSLVMTSSHINAADTKNTIIIVLQDTCGSVDWVVQYIGVREPAAAICKGVLNCKLESKLKVTISGLSRKFLKPFILGNFSFSVYQNETFNTQNVRYNGVFSCVKWTEWKLWSF